MCVYGCKSQGPKVDQGRKHSLCLWEPGTKASRFECPSPYTLGPIIGHWGVPDRVLGAQVWL